MKKLLLLLLLFTSLLAQSQQYNNEWINYNQTYYKFKVGATGLYRIKQSTLAAMSIQNTPVEQFQLWRNGVQVPIYTTIQTGIMGGADYIEFWGERNDGKPDRSLFRYSDYQLNDKYSLETDTASFFLTIHTTVSENKRLVPTINGIPTALSAEPYFMYTAGKYYRERINLGIGYPVGSNIYSAAYDSGEGWTSTDLGAGATRAETFSGLNAYTGPGAPDPNVKVSLTGNVANPRQVEIQINGNQLALRTMDFWDYLRIEVPTTVAQLSSGTATIQVINRCTIADRVAIAQTELTYARQFNFGGADNFAFELPAKAGDSYLEISGFNHGGISPVLYDFTNGKRYVCDITAAPFVKVVLQASATPRSLMLVTQTPSFPADITTLQQRNFINYALPANQGNYLIVSHPALTTSSNGTNPIDAYKTYRSSAPGGSYNAKIYMIDQLIDQFAFGIKIHPESIRNFNRWARNTFSQPVKDILLIGKGVRYDYFRTGGGESSPLISSLNFVPSFGVPASDILMAANPNLDGIPKVSIGRISAITGDEVMVYLSKVIQYEQQQALSSPLISDKGWMKNVVHVVGASDASLQSILDVNMTNYKKIITDTFYGARVSSFSKSSVDPVEQSNSIRLQNLFQEGIGIVTYFGHSSATTLEYNLDNPQNYNNQGKYPLFILLGCNAGNFFTFNAGRLEAKETISEKYVLAKDRGGIASIASTSLGIVHYLDIHNTETYTAITKTKYGGTIGEIMNEAILQVYNITTQSDPYARMQCEQSTLHGDPAIRLNASPKPDYVIEAPLVNISPSFISVNSGAFKVDASFDNIGKAISKSIVVQVERTYPDNSTEIIQRDTIPGIRYSDSLSYSFNIVGTRDKGLNKIKITVDADNEVDELYETNNTVTKDIFIYEDEASPVSPYRYAIVNQQNIKLFASTANPFSTMKQYNMEIDTTELFNSAAKVTKTLNSTGGLLEFTPGITFTDSTVYYWRVAPIPASGPVVNWNVSSFVYLPNSDPGFNQSHYFQHANSDKTDILLDAGTRKWKFDSSSHFIFAKNGVFGTASGQEGDFIVSPDGDPYIRSACVGFSVIYNVFNPKTFKPLENPNNRYGSGDYCQPSRLWNFEYSYMTPATRKLAMDFIDSIPDGSFVVIRNIMNDGQVGGFIDDWKADDPINNKTLYHKFKSIGFNQIDSFTAAKSFIYIFQKGNPGFTPASGVTVGKYDLVAITKDLKTPDTIAYIKSPAFGRARAWKHLKWNGTSSPDITAGDAPTVDVIGVNNLGAEVPLINGLTTSQQDYDISSIDATQYPYVKLRMRNADSINFTAHQLRYWMLTYDPVPEGVISPNLFLSAKDTVDIGEPMNFKVAFKNVAGVPFTDSMKVKVVITDKNNLAHIVPIKYRKILAYPDSIHIGTTISTVNIPGANTIFIEANYDNDQPEQYHFNNFGFRSLYVRPDSLNPLLDVTFDGQHILNRDIVSPKPDIIVKLKDEAKWLSLNDTSLLTVNVRYPNGTLRRFYFNNDTLQFTPAGQAPTTDNTAMINFKPYFTIDGDYELIVTGKDRSENAAGKMEYRVMFEVINKPMISNMLNYPNPFTTSTAFVFTITGTEVPQNIKIEIMTVTGKIVREITKNELGPLQIGRNITEFKWDGTDQFGQKLANGIYLYRVVTNLNGKSLDKYKAKDDNTDKYFNKGYGKMYLMR